jgi:hypothetical protein
MEKEESSIEWLCKELESYGDPQFCEIEWKQLDSLIEQAKEMHKQEIEQHAINFYLFVENDEVTDQKVEIVENLYKDYLKEFYNETFEKL